MTRSTSVHCQSIQVRSDNLIICCLSIWLMVTRQKVTKRSCCTCGMMDGMMLNGGRGGLPPAQFLTNLVSVFSSLPVLGPRPSFRERFEVNLATPLLPLFSLSFHSPRWFRNQGFAFLEVLQTQAFNAIFEWWDLYWKWEEATSEGKVQVTKSTIPLRKKVPHIW